MAVTACLGMLVFYLAFFFDFGIGEQYTLTKVMKHHPVSRVGLTFFVAFQQAFAGLYLCRFRSVLGWIGVGCLGISSLGWLTLITYLEGIQHDGGTVVYMVFVGLAWALISALTAFHRQITPWDIAGYLLFAIIISLCVTFIVMYVSDMQAAWIPENMAFILLDLYMMAFFAYNDPDPDLIF